MQPWIDSRQTLGWTPHAPWMHPRCTENALLTHPRCTLETLQIHLNAPENRQKVNPGNTINGLQMYSGAILETPLGDQ